jgi:hypothetical protein
MIAPRMLLDFRAPVPGISYNLRGEESTDYQVGTIALMRAPESKSQTEARDRIVYDPICAQELERP